MLTDFDEKPDRALVYQDGFPVKVVGKSSIQDYKKGI